MVYFINMCIWISQKGLWVKLKGTNRYMWQKAFAKNGHNISSCEKLCEKPCNKLPSWMECKNDGVTSKAKYSFQLVLYLGILPCCERAQTAHMFTGWCWLLVGLYGQASQEKGQIWNLCLRNHKGHFFALPEFLTHIICEHDKWPFYSTKFWSNLFSLSN